MSQEQEPKDSDDSEDSSDIEDWQYEHSVKLSDAVIDEVLAAVEVFDFDNDDDKYIAGTATVGLWCRLTATLGEMGYTTEELAEMIDEYIYLEQGHTLH